jgi:hypothetical protein
MPKVEAPTLRPFLNQEHAMPHHDNPNLLGSTMTIAAAVRDTVCFEVDGSMRGTVYVAEGLLTAAFIDGQPDVPALLASAGLVEDAAELTGHTDSWWVWQHILSHDGVVEFLRALTVYNIDQLLEAKSVRLRSVAIDPLTSPFAMHTALRHSIPRALNRHTLSRHIRHLLDDSTTLCDDLTTSTSYGWAVS